MSVRWHPSITAKLPGIRAHQVLHPIETLDQGSAANSGYWIARTLDRLHKQGARIVRIQITGEETE
jgi:hypothetical protein